METLSHPALPATECRLTREQRDERNRLLADADRAWAGSARRRLVRVAICANMGDWAGVTREMRAGVYEAQAEAGMSRQEVMRRTMPGQTFLVQRRPGAN